MVLVFVLVFVLAVVFWRCIGLGLCFGLDRCLLSLFLSCFLILVLILVVLGFVDVVVMFFFGVGLVGGSFVCVCVLDPNLHFGEVDKNIRMFHVPTPPDGFALYSGP